MAGLATAFGSGASTNSIEEIRFADVIFILGSNTSAQHPLVYARVADAKKTRGARLIVADPRTTPVAALADEHLALRPGSNLALVNAMLRVILDEGLEDRAFIAARTENVDALRASLAGCTPEWAAGLTGLPPEAIRRAARLYAAGPASTILYCMGVTQHVTGTRTCAALANLAMLCGMVGRPSTGLNPLRGQNNVQGACDMGALPETLPGYLRAGGEEARARFAPLWGSFANTVGLRLTGITAGMNDGTIRAVHVIGENPLQSDPDTRHVAEGFRNTDFLLVQDLFLTPTAELADVVLPAASYLEKQGTFTNTERRVQLVNEVLPPLPGARPDWRILADLIRLMRAEGTPPADYPSPKAVFAEIRKANPAYAGMTYSRLAARDGLCWPCPDENHPGTPILHTSAFSRGRGLFTVNLFDPAERACGLASPSGTNAPGETEDKGGPDQAPRQDAPGGAPGEGSPLSDADVDMGETPDDAYPFTLITGRVSHHYHTGTMTRRSWALQRETPEAFLEMHPDDAARLGLKNDWKILIRSRRGSVTARLRVTPEILPGVVFLPFHFAESSANVLTDHQRLDPVAGIPALKMGAVAVEEAK